MARNAKMAKNGLVGKVVREKKIMLNDFNKSVKGYKNLGRIEDN